MATDRESSHHSAPSGRGFAGMDAERQREIASQGGRAAHEHEFDSAEAREAGRKSGQAAKKRHGS